MIVIEDFNHWAQYADNMGRVADRAVNTTIKRIEARAKASLGGPRSGREYRRGKGGTIIHKASAPGEAPATDTGNLANSIGSQMTGRAVGEVTVNAKDAAALELGSAHIAPRPFFAPAVKAEWPAFLQAMKAVAE